MARRARPPAVRPSAYESLIDAEREALVQAGRTPRRRDLVRALRSAAPELPARTAARAVDGYIADRGGLIPATDTTQVDRGGWIDGLLDAERAQAARDDRPVTRRGLRRAVRQATPHLSPQARRAALADYLHRRGGHPATPRSWPRWVSLAVLVALGALALWLVAQSVWR